MSVRRMPALLLGQQVKMFFRENARINNGSAVAGIAFDNSALPEKLFRCRPDTALSAPLIISAPKQRDEPEKTDVGLLMIQRES